MSLSDLSAENIWFKFPNSQTSYMFGVRACANAIITLLSGGQGSESIYVIALGAESNTLSRIIRGESVLAETKTPDVLSCDEDRWFFISWKTTSIEVTLLKIQNEAV